MQDNVLMSGAAMVDCSAEQGTFFVHELIARQAGATPDGLAVRDQTQELTFLELEERANRLARHLQALGVAAEIPVGLYFERSVDFVVAALAVMKAGGAYVPLDPAYPPARIDVILKDAGVPVLLSHKWLAAGLAGGPWKTVDLDVDAAAIANQPAQPLATQVARRSAGIHHLHLGLHGTSERRRGDTRQPDAFDLLASACL